MLIITARCGGSLLEDWLDKKLCELNVTDSMNKPEGFSRLGYTDEEKVAHQRFITIAKELGLSTYQDQAGNQWAKWVVDEHAPTIGLGSHLDTVYSGGGFDGVAGVLTAFGAIKLLKEKQFIPKKNIALICFASEESARFGVSTIGSKAISGELEKEKIANIKDSEGITIKEAVEQFGVDWKTMDSAELPADELEQFLELHIEQGKVLDDQGLDIGIVNGIARPVRLQVKATGMANHTGTTPMNYRKDALVAIAPLINYVENEAIKINERKSGTLVATVSVARVLPNAMNMIPGEVELGIDIRSTNDQLKNEMSELINKYCEKITEDKKIEVTVNKIVDDASVNLDKLMQGKLYKLSESMGLRTICMDSGAGHDVMNMASKWPCGLIFIPSKHGISHHPEEYTKTADLYKGTSLIARYLEQEA